MKIVKVLLFALLIVSTSCKNEDIDIIDAELKAPVLKELIGSKVAHQEAGKVILDVTDDMIMKSFKRFVVKNNLELTPRSFKVVSIDEKKYMRFYSDNDQVSTVALIKDENNLLRFGTTVCTSTACASGGGCVPDGVYCTKCETGTPIKGDCKRTTTGNQE